MSALAEMGTVLAQQKFCTETITAEHHVSDTGSYTYTVRIDGGEHGGIEFHCRTAASTFWLFDQVVSARREHRHWDWLA